MTFVDDLEEGAFLKMTQLFHLNYNVDPEAGFGIESGATGIRCHHAPSRRSRTSPSCKSTFFVSVILVRRGSGRLLALSVLVTARRSRPVGSGPCATIVCEFAAVVRDYGMSERRNQAPADSRAVYDVPVRRSQSY
jgi:hypothetical protein